MGVAHSPRRHVEPGYYERHKETGHLNVQTTVHPTL
jgi:hypothetical protein